MTERATMESVATDVREWLAANWDPNRSLAEGRPVRRHPLQLQRVETPSRPRRPGCTPHAASGRPCGVTRMKEFSILHKEMAHAG